jgi:hypothetical protein
MMPPMPPAEAEAAAPTAAQMGGKMRAIGSRAEVMHGTAHHTSGGLTRKHLKYNKHGRIVSRKASEAGKKALKRLERAGYKAKKGKFMLFSRKRRRVSSCSSPGRASPPASTK